MYSKGFDLHALDAMLDTLVAHMPTGPRKREALRGLSKWLKSKGASGSLSALDWKTEVDRQFNRVGWTVSVLRWKKCQGSQPHQRGYFCKLTQVLRCNFFCFNHMHVGTFSHTLFSSLGGLWTLLHALTVSAAINHGATASKTALSSVMGYITSIFSCVECARDFPSGAIFYTQELKITYSA